MFINNTKYFHPFVLIICLALLILLTIFPFVDWSPANSNPKNFYWGKENESVSLSRFDFIFNPSMQSLHYRSVTDNLITLEDSLIKNFYTDDTKEIVSITTFDTIDYNRTDSLKSLNVFNKVISLFRADSSIFRLLYNDVLNAHLNNDGTLKSNAQGLYAYLKNYTSYSNFDIVKSPEIFRKFLNESPVNASMIYNLIHKDLPGKSLFSHQFGSNESEYLYNVLIIDSIISSYQQFSNHLLSSSYNISKLFNYLFNIQLHNASLSKLAVSDYAKFLSHYFKINLNDLYKPVMREAFNVHYNRLYFSNFQRSINFNLQILGFLLIIFLGFFIQFLINKRFTLISNKSPLH